MPASGRRSRGKRKRAHPEPTRRTIAAGRVGDIMAQQVVTVRPETPVRDLKALFDCYDYNAFPVVEADQRLVGVVTKLDFLRLFRAEPGRAVPAVRALWGEQVRDIMRRGVLAVEPDEPLEAVIDLMLEFRLRSVPVVERGPKRRRRVVGMVSRRDVLGALLVDGEGEQA